MSLDLTHKPRTHFVRGLWTPATFRLNNCGAHDDAVVEVCTLCGCAYAPTKESNVCAGKLAKALTPDMIDAVLHGKELVSESVDPA